MLVRDFKTTAVPTLKETRNHMKTIGFFFNQSQIILRVCACSQNILILRQKYSSPQ